MPRPRLAEAIKLKDDPALAGAIADYLIAKRKLNGNEHAIAHPDYSPKLSKKQVQLQQQVINTFFAAGVAPQSLATIAKDAGTSETDVKPIVELSAALKSLVHIGAGMYLHADVEHQIRETIAKALAHADGLTMSELRELIGTSRKYAVPIFEHLDRVGLTKRRGDVRVLA